MVVKLSVRFILQDEAILHGDHLTVNAFVNIHGAAGSAVR